MAIKFISRNIVETVRIRINNLIALAVFSTLRIFFLKKNQDSSNSILFINTGLLGDVIISTVIFVNEKELFKLFDKIYFVVNKQYEEVFNGYTGGINIIYLDFMKYRFRIPYRINFLSELKKLKVNKSFNISFARRIIDDEISLLNGAEEKICYSNNPKMVKSFSKYMDSFYDDIRKPGTINHFNELAGLLKQYGVADPINATKVFCINSRPEFKKFDFDNIKGRKIISVSPFASNPLKNWEWAKYIELINMIINEYDPAIFILGDNKKLGYLIDRERFDGKVINALGLTSLFQASYILSMSELFVGNDSGLYHIAKAYNIKRICISGGGAMNITQPYSSGENEVLLYKEMDCFGCHWKCIYDYAFCMQDVSPLQAFDSVKKVLSDD